MATLASHVDPENHRAIAAVARLGGVLVEGPEDVATYRHNRPLSC